MVTASLINRLSQAVDLLEQRSQQNRPWKIVKVPCGLHEDRDVALARHYRVHPDARGANITVFEFYDDREMAAESQDGSRRAQTAEFKDRDL